MFGYRNIEITVNFASILSLFCSIIIIIVIIITSLYYPAVRGYATVVLES